MKKLYLIGGPMGVGKTAVSRALQQRLDRCVFLDGDRCWDAHPFTVTAETKKMVLGNIAFLLNSFIRCSAYENIVLCWVMHRQQIIEDILNRLDTQELEIRTVLLICSEETLKKDCRKI